MIGKRKRANRLRPEKKERRKPQLPQIRFTGVQLPIRTLSIAAVLMSLLLITGCQGCRNLDEDEIAKKKEEEKKKKKKPPFETRTPVVLPGYFPTPKETDEQQEDEENQDPLSSAIANMGNSVIRFNRTKLGHWVAAPLCRCCHRRSF